MLCTVCVCIVWYILDLFEMNFNEMNDFAKYLHRIVITDHIHFAYQRLYSARFDNMYKYIDQKHETDSMTESHSNQRLQSFSAICLMSAQRTKRCVMACNIKHFTTVTLLIESPRFGEWQCGQHPKSSFPPRFS